MPMARAAWRFEPVAESAAMKARWRSAVQPSERLVLRGTGVKSRRSPRWEKSSSPEKPVERQRSQMTGMVLIDELEAREILIGKGRMRGSLGAAP
jgi:hypothetical protein